MGYCLTKEDPDVWKKPKTKENGFKYYDIILCYVDDVIDISERLMQTIEGIKSIFKLKRDKVELSDMYLGGSIFEATTGSGTERWTLPSNKYIQTEVSNVKTSLSREHSRFQSRCDMPIKSKYHLSEDISKELDSEGTWHYQELICVLC